MVTINTYGSDLLFYGYFEPGKNWLLRHLEPQAMELAMLPTT